MTSLKDQEAQITADLTTIRDLWPNMLPTLKAIPLGQLGGGSSRSSTAKDADNGNHNTDVDNLDIVMSDRGDITAVLQGWARVVVEDFGADPVEPCKHDRAVTLTWPWIGPTLEHCATGRSWTKGRMHQITGHDVHGMCVFLERWARSMTGHVACDDFVEELHDCARKVLKHARPTRKDWLGIGVCPLRNDETGQPCSGNVRAYPDQDAGESWATCQTCGTRAVVSWWEHEIFGGESSGLVTAAELRLFVHREFGRVVGDATIRQWVKRGWIEPSGSDSEGRTLYDKGAVAYALQRRQAV